LPLAAYYLTEAIDRRAQYLGFIVAYNWSALIQLAVVLPVAILAQSGVLPAGMAQAATFGAYVAILIYEWFIVRTALNLSNLGAVGVVALDVVMSLLINDAGDYVARVS
jgi:hypothetical protein